MLVQVVENHFGLLATLQLEDDAHAVAIAFVANFGNAFQTFFVDQAGGVLDQPRLVDLIRKLSNDNGFPIFAKRFGFRERADFDGAAAVAEIIEDALAAEDQTAGGKIGALDDLDQLSELNRGVLDQGNAGFDDLSEIVGRDLAGHADRDALA